MMLDVFLDSLSGVERCFEVAMLYLHTGPKESISRRTLNLYKVLRRFVENKRFFSVEHIAFVNSFDGNSFMYALRVPRIIYDRSAMFALLSARHRRVGAVSAVRRLPVEMVRMVAEFLWTDDTIIIIDMSDEDE
jgi:hypothetical protein